jgi:hypothetical protein
MDDLDCEGLVESLKLENGRLTNGGGVTLVAVTECERDFAQALLVALLGLIS